jgi:glycosyltransferase involved in cell wall biosynthesis
MSIARIAGRGALPGQRVVDVARRAARSLPAPVRDRLRDAVTWSDRRPPPPLADWSAPLIRTAPGTGDLGAASLIGTSGAAAGPDVIGHVRSHDAAATEAGGDAGQPALRCLVVTSRLDVGGLEEMVAFLARRLPGQRFHTAVLHTAESTPADGQLSGRLARMLQAGGITVRELGRDDAAEWIRQWQPDVISAHGAPYWTFATAQRLGVPYVDNMHGMYRLFGGDWQWHAEAARGTGLAAVVAVSELVRQQYLADNPGFPPGRIVTIPNGVDDERRPAGDRDAVRGQLGLTSEYLFVSLARYGLQKNPYGLLSAFGELALRRPEAHLVIAGRPDDLRYYRRVLQLRDGLPARDHIHLRDHVAAPADLLAAADGFVLDSFFEGWSLASMEALFAGVPVVVSDVGGAREQVGDDPARGYVVANPLGDALSVTWEAVGQARFRAQVNAGELVTAMEHLVADRDSYLSGRAALAAESAARFGADACLRQHAELLRRAGSSARVASSSQT